MKKKILVFSGAGVSKESGIETFRDSNESLWNNYSIEDVATLNGWIRDKELVLDFYNNRRTELKSVEPNEAHKLVAKLQEDFDVTVITQNVDNLHERAGSNKVIHLHGELTKVRSTMDPSIIYDWYDDVKIGDKCKLGSQLRPHIVWFGEVSPANEIPMSVPLDTPIYYIDPGTLGTFLQYDERSIDIIHIKENATVGMKKIYELITKINPT